MKITLHQRSEPCGLRSQSLHATIGPLEENRPLFHYVTGISRIFPNKCVSRSLEIFSACEVLSHASIKLPPRKPRVLAWLPCRQLGCLTTDKQKTRKSRQTWVSVSVGGPEKCVLLLLSLALEISTWVIMFSVPISVVLLVFSVSQVKYTCIE